MDSTIVIALCSGLSAAAGSVISAITASRLTAYKLEQMQRRIEAHEKTLEKISDIALKIGVLEEELKGTKQLLQIYHKEGC